MKRIALVLAGLLLPQWAMALTVTTTVEPTEVGPGESVVVTFEVDGQAGQPDFTPLQEDFEIVDQRQSQNIAVVNGRASYEMVWSLVLTPKQTGELSLPAIDFGGVASDSRTIRVVDDAAAASSVPSATQSSDPSGDVLLEYRVDDPTPYANQQVLLTTQVYTAVEVEDLTVSAPGVAAGEAEINQLGRAREYESMRDGRRYTVREQRYTLVPQSTGELELTPVELTGRVDGESIFRRAQPPRIEVITASAEGSSENRALAPEDLFVEIALDKTAPYVQEQVMLTVRLLRAVAIENATLSAPTVSGGDAVFERLGNDRQFQTTRDGRRYSVTERRFVLFPQTSGALTLEPVRLQASVPVAYSGGATTGFWSRPLTRPVRVQSEARELDVKAPPEGAPRPWLPAAGMTLEEEWPERDQFEVGAPITRRIIVTADELLASQLPALDTPLPDGVKSYPEKPRRDTSAAAHGATGRLEQTVTLIPSRAGTFRVPALELQWWNTGKEQFETLRLPSHTFEVVAAAGSAPAPAAPVEGAADPGAAPRSGPGLAWWVSLGLALAWLATLGLWWRDRQARSAPSDDQAASLAESRGRAERRLRAACRAGDPAAARDALLTWGRACLPERPPRSLGALAAAIGDDTLAAEIARLQQALYAPGEATWQGDALQRAVATCDPSPADAGRDAILKPLYQH